MARTTTVDVLSDVFDQIDVTGLLTGGFAARGPWLSQGAVTRPLKLIALVAGTARLTVEGPDGSRASADLAPGDVALLNHRTHLHIGGGRGDGPPVELIPEARFDSMALAAADPTRDDILVGGVIEVGPAGLALIGAALPGLVHVSAGRPAATRMAGLVQQLFDEASSGRIGSAFALRQHGQLLLLEVLRSFLEQDEPPAGWLRLLADAQLAPALSLMHDRPGHPWALLDLARAAGMSRTSFCTRFRTAAGMPPLTYLARWRMTLAQRALRDADTRIGDLATELGYASDAAFSTAFKREVGESPARYRRRLDTSA